MASESQHLLSREELLALLEQVLRLQSGLEAIVEAAAGHPEPHCVGADWFVGPCQLAEEAIQDGYIDHASGAAAAWAEAAAMARAALTLAGEGDDDAE